MKIDAVDTFLAHTYLLVRLRTDTGITGWGQTAYFSYPEAAQQVVERYGRNLLKAPLTREGGYLLLPDGPGLGVEVDETFLAAHPFKAGTPRAPLHADGSVAVH